jgi:tetratricopeptide (TPR) repeat protein
LAGYVVCEQCGTRIKAGRAYCLRCGHDLPPDGAEIKVSVWESLELSQGKLLALAVAAGLSVIALVGVIMRNQPVPADEIAKPVGVAAEHVDKHRPSTEPAEQAEPSLTPLPDTAAPSPTPAAAPIGTPTSSADGTRAGASAFRAGHFEAARTAFEQVLAKTPDDADALNNLGQTLVRLGKLDEAMARFERAIALAPSKAAFHFNLGHALGQRGNWQRAIVEYREAVRLFPEDYAAQYNLALAIKKTGDDKGAIPEFQKAIALAPGEPSFHLSLAMSLEQVGRVLDAVKEYRKFLEMAPAAPEAEQLKTHVDALSARAAKPSAAY